jgi:hypothetical protein
VAGLFPLTPGLPNNPTHHLNNSKLMITMNEHTLTQLRTLRLDGMVRALEDQATSTAASVLGFEDRFSLLVQRQVAWRDDRRVDRLLKAAKLKVSSACVEDINWRASRSLDRSWWPHWPVATGCATPRIC